jgi:hypothetical protein
MVVGFVGCVCGAGARSKREPGLLLEEALPSWAFGSDGGAEQQVRLLPVSVSDEQPAETEPEEATSPASGVTINIEFPGRTLVSVEGAVGADIVRAVVESLRG